MNHVTRRCIAAISIFGLVLVLVPATFRAAPSVYPTGTTIYDPGRAWNGYTIFRTPNNQGDVLIDMNGQELRRWPEASSQPARILPGGHVVGGAGARTPHQEFIALIPGWNFDDMQVESLASSILLA